MTRWWWGVIPLALIALGWALTRPAQPAGARAPAAPTFVAQTLDSVAVPRTGADYAGMPMLLNVWATWCDPCREEMPSLQRLHESHGPRGLKVVAVSVDDRGNEGLIREFVASYGLTFDILHDPSSAIMDSLKVRGVPSTYLINRRGELVATRFVEDWSSSQNRALVDSLLLGGT